MQEKSLADWLIFVPPLGKEENNCQGLAWSLFVDLVVEIMLHVGCHRKSL